MWSHMHVEVREDNFQELVLYFHHVSPRNQTQVIGFVPFGKYPYLYWAI